MVVFADFRGYPGFDLQRCGNGLLWRDIVHEFITTGGFPSPYKIANICPVFKTGDRSDPTKYRPISLLPIASKLLERIVYDQLRQYIRTTYATPLIPNEQFAYRQSHSCEDALAVCIDSWQHSLDNRNVVAVATLLVSRPM